MRRGLRWLLPGLVLALPAWLLASENGLRFALYCVERATHGMVTVQQANGRIVNDFSLRGLVIETPAATVRIDQADLNLRLTHLLVARVQAEWVVVHGLAVIVHDRPPSPTHTPLTLHAPVYLAVEEGRLTDFHLRLAHATQDWVLPEAQFKARWRGRWIRIGTLAAVTHEAGPVALHGRISIADDQLHFEDFEIERPSRVTVFGALALADVAQNQLELHWERLRWPNPEVLPFLSSPSGTLKLEGPWHQYAWRVDAQTLGLDVAGELAARGKGDLRAVALENVRVKALDGSIWGQGRVEWSPALRTDLSLRWENLNPVSRFKEWPGKLNGGVTLRARWPERRAAIEFDGGFDDSQLRGYPFSVEATGATEAGKLLLKQFALRSGVSQVSASGQLLPEMALSGDLQSTDLGSLWNGLSGRTSLHASAAGPFAAPRIAVKGTVDDLTYLRYRVTHGAIDAQLALAGHSQFKLQLDDVLAGLPLSSITASGEGTRAAHALRIAVVGRSLPGEQSAASVSLALAGGEQGGGWRGRMTQMRIAPAIGDAFELEEPAALAFARGHFDTEPVCLGASESRACARLGFGAGRSTVAFRIRDFDLKHLRAWLPGEWTLAGTVSGTSRIEIAGGELSDLRSDLHASAGFVEGGGVHMDFGPGRFVVEPDGVRLHAQWQLQPAGGDISGEAWAAPGAALLDRPMLGDVHVHLPDLRWLPVLSPEIAAAQGSIDAQLDLSGTPRAPSLDGKVQLANGRVQLTTPGIELTDITASFERGRNAPLLLHAQATSGGGKMTLEGALKTLQPKLAGQITIKGQDVLGMNRPDIRAWLSPDLTLALDGRNAKLTGELGVPRAEITPKKLTDSGVATSSDQVIVHAEEEAAATPGRGVLVESEVKIALGDNVNFEGFGLKTRLTGAITAIDSPGSATRGVGEFRLDGGRYKAYGQDLFIEKGRLIFSGGPVGDPAIDITAIRRFGPQDQSSNAQDQPLRVGLRARGTLAAPELTLFSDPTMTQEQQLAYIVLGHPLTNTADTAQRNQLSAAAAMSGGEFLAQRLAPRLGLDEVTIASKPGEATDLARFTVGKYLSPRVFVSWGYGIFQGGNFFRMQYDLNRHVKLVGETGLEQGGDVLYSIER